MKFIIDEHIPFIKGVFEPFATVVYADPAHITSSLVKEADALIIRTRTHCNRALLEDSSVKFIATATIGYDHIDTAYCLEKGVHWTNAAGCNANAVRQYIEAALNHIEHTKQVSFKGKTMGVVGVGNVGERIAKMAEERGMRVLRNDPPRADAEGLDSFVSLERIAKEADIVTFHTPLTEHGAYKSYHLCNEELLSKLKRNAVIINCARGGVIDEEALLAQEAHFTLVVDCWEGEPHINRTLLERAYIATFHIAGYSLQGKINATTMVVRAVSRFFSLGLNYWEVNSDEIATKGQLQERWEDYDIMKDVALLRTQPEAFETLRSGYRFR